MKKSEKQAKEILDDLNYYDPGSTYYEDGVKRIAAMIEAAYPEMEAVGWCVFMKAVGWCVFDGHNDPMEDSFVNANFDMADSIELFQLERVGDDTWEELLKQGYTVEQVYRKILPAKIAKLEE